MTAAEILPGTTTWPAQLNMQFEPRGARTVMSRCRHRGPLRVQRPFYPEGAPCHVYVLHPPGGIVGGDTLEVDVQVKAGAHALLTTPAATKFYRCDARSARQRQTLHVCADAKLEWLPQDSIVFDGSNAESDTRVDLEHGARFVGWELFTLGRPASSERFTAGRLTQRLELWRARTPVLIERTRFHGDDAALYASWGLQGHVAFATMVATPAHAETLATARRTLAAHPDNSLRAAFTLKGDVLVGRCIAQSAPAIQRAFAAVWGAIRAGVMECTPCEPRIWRT